MVRPVPKVALFFPRDRKDVHGIAERFRLKKSKEVGPGQYKVNKRLTEKKTVDFTFSKGANKNYIEQYVRSKKPLPGVGKYKSPERCFDFLSRPLSGMLRKRT